MRIADSLTQLIQSVREKPMFYQANVYLIPLTIPYNILNYEFSSMEVIYSNVFGLVSQS